MKIKRFNESLNDELRCTIDIRFLTTEEIIKLCKNIIKIFSNYSFSEIYMEIANENPKYIRWLSDYSHIELSSFYTFFEAGEYDPIYYFSHSGTKPIDGKIFLNSNTKEELIENIELYKETMMKIFQILFPF